MKSFTPEQVAALQALSAALVESVAGTTLTEELKAVRDAGVEIFDVSITINAAPREPRYYGSWDWSAPRCGAPAPQSDADFLSSLHITPDLEAE